jgi:uncharacterized protein (DUF1800 family)
MSVSATDHDLAAAIAATRFGLGAKPGEIAQARGDPQGWLRAQIRSAGADIPQSNGEDTRQRLVELREYQQDRQQLKQQVAATDDGKPGDPKTVPQDRDPVQMARRLLRDNAGEDFLARATLGATTDAAFRERWALFWANHFTVSASKFATANVIGPFEAEALRPHVFGRFVDLLTAVESHPAMLLYLDQSQSVGPDSRAAQFAASRPAGQVRKLGLNENLAREIMELHTVGVNGGYTQADVTEFARAMTGVSVGGLRDPSGEGGAFFRVNAHEPGDRTVLGVHYRQGDQEQSRAILADLAAKPATAAFVCSKIARHFVADDPPPALVARLRKAWMGSGGDLATVAEALVTAPEAWSPTPAKFKTPYEFIVSSYRAANLQPTAVNKIAPILAALGQKPFTPPSPKGWPETAGDWAAPDAIVKRMQFAQGFAAVAVQDRDPKELARDALGARLSDPTALAIARAESRTEGFALLLMTPEFQRR